MNYTVQSIKSYLTHLRDQFDFRENAAVPSKGLKSNYDRQRWAEGLIRQLPKNHDGRNSWLLNYGEGREARSLRTHHPHSIPWDEEDRSSKDSPVERRDFL